MLPLVVTRATVVDSMLAAGDGVFLLVVIIEFRRKRRRRRRLHDEQQRSRKSSGFDVRTNIEVRTEQSNNNNDREIDARSTPSKNSTRHSNSADLLIELDL